MVKEVVGNVSAEASHVAGCRISAQRLMDVHRQNYWCKNVSSVDSVETHPDVGGGHHFSR